MEKVNQASVDSIMTAQPAGPPDGTGKVSYMHDGRQGMANCCAGVIKLDPWLSPFKDSLKKRFSKAQDWISAIDKSEGGLEKFSRVRAPPLSPYIEHKLIIIRDLRSLDSMSTRATTLHTGNGLPMQRRHSLLVILVRPLTSVSVHCRRLTR